MSPKHRDQKRVSRAIDTKAPQGARINPAVQPPAPLPGDGIPGRFRWQIGLAGFFTLVFFVLYFMTASRSVPTGDSSELITAAWTLGVAHQPGYPTFTMLSHLAGYLPFGSPAFRLNLLSALLDALALGVLTFGCLRFWGKEQDKPQTKWYRLIPITGTVAGIGLLAVSDVFWLYSTAAEVFALNNLLAALTLVLMLEWVRQPERKRYLYISGFLAGLALTNQLTFILLAPALITLLIAGIVRWRKKVRSAMLVQKGKLKDPGWRLADIGIVAGLFIVGLLPYIYLPVAAHTDPAINFGNPGNFNNFWHVITRSNVGTFSFMSGGSHGNAWQQMTFLGGYFLHSFTIVGVLLAVIGAVWFARKRPMEGIALGLAFLFSGPLFALFANPDLNVALTQGVFERFYILPGIPLALFAVGGAIFLMELAVKWAAKVRLAFTQQTVIMIGLIAAAAMVISLMIIRLPSINLSNNRVVEDYGKDLLEPLEPNALLIISNDYNFGSAVYTQLVTGIRSDVIVLHAELLKGTWYVEQQKHLHPEVVIPFNRYNEGPRASITELINSNIGARPVYAAGTIPEDVSQSYDKVYWGLSFRFVRKGEVADKLALMRPESQRFAALHYPQKVYPPKYWEYLIAEQYGQLAFLLAYDRQQPKAQPDAAYVERMYRIAIQNAPHYALSYKNLGLLFLNNGHPRTETVALWEKYLEMAPDDPEAAQMRLFIKTGKDQ